MSVLWRAHDRHRDFRAWLPAELAPDTEQDRHVMSQTSCERCGFPVPMRWLDAGGDLSRPNGIHQAADRALMPPEHSPKRLPHSPDLPCDHTCAWPRAGVVPIIEIGANIKST
jgi:hypothetical protein